MALKKIFVLKKESVTNLSDLWMKYLMVEL